MKECPKGHMYPDALTQCPVCDKSAELKTTLYKSAFSDQYLNRESKKLVPESNPAVFADEDRRTISNMNAFDADKTILIGQAIVIAESELGAWLIELNDDDVPIKSYQLFLNKTHHIGRGIENDIVLPNRRQSISRHHCMIEYKAPNFIIHDKQSSNGTKVNNKTITSQILTDQSVIIIGDQKYWIKYLQRSQ